MLSELELNSHDVIEGSSVRGARASQALAGMLQVRLDLCLDMRLDMCSDMCLDMFRSARVRVAGIHRAGYRRACDTK